MKFIFRGWRREVVQHEHSAFPVEMNMLDGQLSSGEKGTPIKWHSETQARARINGLALSGDFLVEIKFETEELQNWIRQCIHSNPENTIKSVMNQNSFSLI